MLACATLAQSLFAQERVVSRPTPQRTPTHETKQSAKNTAAKTREAKLKEKRERQQAVAVLLEVTGSAREIEELYQRADVLTFCADALWETDEQTARALFRRAWDAASESDDAELKDEQQNGRYGDLPERFTRARELVLATAGRRDARMAEGFLRRLVESLNKQPSSARDLPEEMRDAASRDIGPLNEFTPGSQRLALAFSLLDEDSYKSAEALVEPALAGSVNGIIIEFLLRLRAYSFIDADRLFLRLLERTRADVHADANDVLLLSSYIFTPRLLVVVDSRGSVRFRPLNLDATTGVRDGTAERSLRANFYDAAAAILLRLAQPFEKDEGGSALITYFAVGRLLPLFERDSPQHAPALYARLNALAAEIESARRASLDSQIKTQSLTSENADDPLRSALEELGRSDPATRDSLRLQMVRDAAKRRLWDRSRRLADEIEDEGKRREARSIIAARQVATLGEAFADDEGNDFEKAVQFVRNAELTPALRAYGFAQAAELAARRGKRARAAALLDEAFSQVSQVENGTSLRDAASMMLATIAARVDSPRAWEMLVAAVVALNDDEKFSGETIWFNMETRVRLSPNEPDIFNDALQAFTVEEMFDAAASRDLSRAVTEARNLKSVYARALALVASVRTVLEKNSKGKSEVTR
jgi:hypothetical protein